ncbi:amidohydrolase family protein, partial [Zoogloea sp.]|uniref:amidohydrolase family protein n=1 Tax=Zoogloea sp. TaxID=49181 RepID=UPI0014162B16
TSAPFAAGRVGDGLIDVHHHHIPPFYLEEYRDRIAGARGGKISPAWLSWSPEKAIGAMDASNVSTAVLSLTTPGLWFGDPVAAARTARQVNEYAAGLGRRFPGRFGLFAALPLPDQEASLREIEYSLDVLKADGIGLLTSYGDKWLGNPDYDAVFAELNRRAAVVFVHPTAPLCCRNLLPDVVPVVAEIPQDTARAITNMLFTGTFVRYRNIRFIFTHAGGNTPMIIGRMRQYGPANLAALAPLGIEGELRRHYFDLAGTANKPAVAAITSIVPVSQILMGSDNPFVPLAETAHDLTTLGLGPADLRAIRRDNALSLLPGLASR